MKEVWRFNAGSDGGVQTNPLVGGRALYGYGPTLQVFALDGATGKTALTAQLRNYRAAAEPSVHLLERRQRIQVIRLHHELPLCPPSGYGQADQSLW
jgi:hypothetical protein